MRFFLSAIISLTLLSFLSIDSHLLWQGVVRGKLFGARNAVSGDKKFFEGTGPVATNKKNVGRYFIEGDGTVTLSNKKTGRRATIQYRQPDGNYRTAGLKEINRIFGVPAGSHESISLRFVSLLDYLQDHFQGAASARGGPASGWSSAPTLQIISGYRNPTYNENLRKRGKLAAKTSLHIEGMAADIEMAGVPPEKLWHFVRRLNCCGTGYYHGAALHIDSGPNRFWDETSTKVETDISTHNKMIMVQTDKDIYRAGETILLSLSRITDYPIGIQKGDQCQILTTRSQTKNIPWPLTSARPIVREHWPDRIHSVRPSGANGPVNESQMGVLRGRAVSPLELEIPFCQKPFPEMPDKITSNEFVVR